MSGWNIPYLSELAFGLFMITVGAMLLLDPVMVAREEARAHDWKLRYGDGGTDLRRAVPRWPAWLIIALGLAHIVFPTRSGNDWRFMLVMGGLILAGGLFFLLFGARYDARRQRRYEAGLDRLAINKDAYSDETYNQELRALQATRPTFVSPRRNRLFDALFAVLGAIFLTLGLLGARQ